jgi:hypothetical protein
MYDAVGSTMAGECRVNPARRKPRPLSPARVDSGDRAGDSWPHTDVTT